MYIHEAFRNLEAFMTFKALAARALDAVRVLVGCVAALIWTAHPASAQTTTVGTVPQLESAVANANRSGGNRTILLLDGVYSLNGTLNVTAPNVTIAGKSGVRENVVIQGDAMHDTARIGNLIRVSARNFGLSGVTLQKSGFHLIQIAGESDADAPVIRNCILRDAYQQMIKVSNDPAAPGVSADNGLVEHCLFEYSAGIGPQFYIGGIDAHASKNWIVRNNTFRNIISPGRSVAEFAIHFWDGSANNTVEKNLIVNCDRGIGFGLDRKGNMGGTIRNNMIYHAANAGRFADAGIALTESPGTQVYNNTIMMDNDFPRAIEYRFAVTTGVLIANNLTNKAIVSRDGASGIVSRNVTNAVGRWFVSPASGDLHLASAIGAVVASGQAVPGLGDDFDGQPRPSGAGVDIGADQFVAKPALPSPGSSQRIDRR
jgi:parallel beta helix pectate lyase-like protein